jgi:hypothetical protein
LFEGAPGAWLFDGHIGEEDSDRDAGVTFLRRHIALLNDTRGEWAEHARMAALAAHMRHGRLAVSESVGSFKLLAGYPMNLTESERRHARQMARMTFDMMIGTDEGTEQVSRAWAERFWIAAPKLARES